MHTKSRLIFKTGADTVLQIIVLLICFFGFGYLSVNTLLL